MLTAILLGWPVAALVVAVPFCALFAFAEGRDSRAH